MCIPDRDSDRVRQDIPGEGFDPGWEGCGEEEGLAVWADMGGDGADLGLEAEVEHAVGFV